jgi:hypothetical protein
MQKRTLGQGLWVWLVAVVLAAVLLSCAGLGITRAAATGTAGGAPAINPSLDMVTALKASGPHPALGEHASVFGQLVGTWDVQYTDFTKDGRTLHRTGELLVGWVMDGRVIQDVWIVDPWGAHKDREVYTDLFYFDAKSQSWHADSIDPQDASVATFTGGATEVDRIVLDSHDLAPAETRRWSFNEIRPDSLVFRDEASRDDGKTWTLKSEYHMKRRAAGAGAQ